MLKEREWGERELSYRVLYREWRPEKFADLVGQDHIRDTICNALVQKKIGHAYLFSGPRGTGKTSLAKILAKTVNCLAPQGIEPCCECQNCLDVQAGRSLDVLEIDAASNRGIEEIRELKEKLNFVPSQGKYKVYIIDEVHMLTTEAFNALLKTLEEPPVHVLFILATTEPQRIPATILSRCQRFDFKKITPQKIEERLKEILNAQQVTAEEGVLDLLVKKAEGGLRDAIGFLDQCLSLENEQLTLEKAYEVLGLVKQETLYALLQAINEQDAAQTLKIIVEVLNSGIEPGQVIKDLLDYLHQLLLLQVCGEETELVLLSSEMRIQMKKQATELGTAWLLEVMEHLAYVESQSRWYTNLKVVLETLLLNLIYRVQQSRQKKEAPLLSVIKEKWPQLMEQIKNSRRALHAFLMECMPHEIKDESLVLRFKKGYQFHCEQVAMEENKKVVEMILQDLLGVVLKIECCVEQ